MSKITAAITAALLALVGALAATTAHATSEHPTPVYFVAVHDRIPRTMDLYNTAPDGTQYKQSLGTVSEHPELVCPKNMRYRLTWSHTRRGEVHRLAPGQCLRPGPGPAYVHVWKSSTQIKNPVYRGAR